MGNCECTQNCKFIGGDIHEVEYENERVKNHSLTNTEGNQITLSGKYLVKGKIIANFITYSLQRKFYNYKKRVQSEKLKFLYRKTTSKVRTIEYYSNKLHDYICNAIRGKEEFFISYTEFEHYISSFHSLRKNIKRFYANEICSKEMNFYNSFLQCFKGEIRKEDANTIEATIDNSIDEKDKETNNYQFNKSIIENDIDNMFSICFDLKDENIPKHLKELAPKQKSFLLLMLTNEFDIPKNKIFMNKTITKFVKKFYFIYLMKKYSFLTRTDEGEYLNFSVKEINMILKENKYDFDTIDEEMKQRYIEMIEKTRKNEQKKKKKKVEFKEFSIDIPENPEIPGEIKEYDVNQVKEKLKSMRSVNAIRNISPSQRRTKIFHSTKNSTTFSQKSTNLYLDENISFGPEYEAPKSSIKNKKAVYYNGEYDKATLLFAGFGTLFKKYKNSIYEGTFRYGKKHGIGCYYRQVTDSFFRYYSGEWTNNHFDGYGFLIEINKKCVTIRKGSFENDTFISGDYYSFFENNESLLEIIKYYGNFKNNKFDSYGTLNKLVYSVNKKTNNLEINEEYEYKGNFKEGKEDSQGECKKNLKTEGYSYTYKGNFQNGLMNGYGIISFSENYFIKQYEGFFINDHTFSTYGIVYFKSGDIYEGFFDEKHQKDYLGLYQHFEPMLGQVSDNFFGFFMKDKKDGLGRFLSPSSKKLLIGNYTLGEKNGIFQLISNGEQKDNNKTPERNNPFYSFFKKSVKGIKSRTKQKTYYYCEDNEVLDSSEKPLSGLFT